MQVLESVPVALLPVDQETDNFDTDARIYLGVCLIMLRNACHSALPQTVFSLSIRDSVYHVLVWFVKHEFLLRHAKCDNDKPDSTAFTFRESTMKHKTRFTPQQPLGRLETLKGHRYTYAEISSFMGVDRQKIRYQLNNPLSEVKTVMLDNWLDFFAAEGMPITISDLFTVTLTPP